MEQYTVTFLPEQISVTVDSGTTILNAQIQAGLHPDAPCGGNGTCGKCRVELDGRVHAIADNGKDRWIFEVLDNERIAFVCSGSTELKLGSQVTLPDGAIFEISQP